MPTVAKPGSRVRSFMTLFVMKPAATSSIDDTAISMPTIVRLSRPTRSDEAAWLSARNLPQVHILEPGQLNTYDVLVSDDVVFTKAAFESFVAGPKAAEKTEGSAA